MILRIFLRIAEMTYTEMVENGSCNSPSMVQDSGLVVNSSCRNCGVKGIRQINVLQRKLLCPILLVLITTKEGGNGLPQETEYLL